MVIKVIQQRPSNVMMMLWSMESLVQYKYCCSEYIVRIVYEYPLNITDDALMHLVKSLHQGRC